jgi:CDGSH-type Zn-finger protein
MDEPVEITFNDRGPMKISGGNFVLRDGQGKQIDLGGKTTVFMCRCGQSSKKPYCDGAHKACGFDSVIVQP